MLLLRQPPQPHMLATATAKPNYKRHRQPARGADVLVQRLGLRLNQTGLVQAFAKVHLRVGHAAPAQLVVQARV